MLTVMISSLELFNKIIILTRHITPFRVFNCKYLKLSILYNFHCDHFYFVPLLFLASLIYEMYRPFQSSLVPLFQCESKCETILMKHDFDLHGNETACRTHFHMKGFALRLVLKPRRKRTRMANLLSSYLPVSEMM